MKSKLICKDNILQNKDVWYERQIAGSRRHYKDSSQISGGKSLIYPEEKTVGQKKCQIKSRQDNEKQIHDIRRQQIVLVRPTSKNTQRMKTNSRREEMFGIEKGRQRRMDSYEISTDEERESSDGSDVVEGIRNSLPLVIEKPLVRPSDIRRRQNDATYVKNQRPTRMQRSLRPIQNLEYSFGNKGEYYYDDLDEESYNNIYEELLLSPRVLRRSPRAGENSALERRLLLEEEALRGITRRRPLSASRVRDADEPGRRRRAEAREIGDEAKRYIEQRRHPLHSRDPRDGPKDRVAGGRRSKGFKLQKSISLDATSEPRHFPDQVFYDEYTDIESNRRKSKPNVKRRIRAVRETGSIRDIDELDGDLSASENEIDERDASRRYKERKKQDKRGGYRDSDDFEYDFLDDLKRDNYKATRAVSPQDPIWNTENCDDLGMLDTPNLSPGYEDFCDILYDQDNAKMKQKSDSMNVNLSCENIAEPINDEFAENEKGLLKGNFHHNRIVDWEDQQEERQRLQEMRSERKNYDGMLGEQDVLVKEIQHRENSDNEVNTYDESVSKALSPEQQQQLDGKRKERQSYDKPAIGNSSLDQRQNMERRNSEAKIYDESHGRNLQLRQSQKIAGNDNERYVYGENVDQNSGLERLQHPEVNVNSVRNFGGAERGNLAQQRQNSEGNGRDRYDSSGTQSITQEKSGTGSALTNPRPKEMNLSRQQMSNQNTGLNVEVDVLGRSGKGSSFQGRGFWYHITPDEQKESNRRGQEIQEEAKATRYPSVIIEEAEEVKYGSVESQRNEVDYKGMITNITSQKCEIDKPAKMENKKGMQRLESGIGSDSIETLNPATTGDGPNSRISDKDQHARDLFMGICKDAYQKQNQSGENTNAMLTGSARKNSLLRSQSMAVTPSAQMMGGGWDEGSETWIGDQRGFDRKGAWKMQKAYSVDMTDRCCYHEEFMGSRFYSGRHSIPEAKISVQKTRRHKNITMTFASVKPIDRAEARGGKVVEKVTKNETSKTKNEKKKKEKESKKSQKKCSVKTDNRGRKDDENNNKMKFTGAVKDKKSGKVKESGKASKKSKKNETDVGKKRKDRGEKIKDKKEEKICDEYKKDMIVRVDDIKIQQGPKSRERKHVKENKKEKNSNIKTKHDTGKKKVRKDKEKIKNIEEGEDISDEERKKSLIGNLLRRKVNDREGVEEKGMLAGKSIGVAKQGGTEHEAEVVSDEENKTKILTNLIRKKKEANQRKKEANQGIINMDGRNNEMKNDFDEVISDEEKKTNLISKLIKKKKEAQNCKKVAEESQRVSNENMEVSDEENKTKLISNLIKKKKEAKDRKEIEKKREEIKEHEVQQGEISDEERKTKLLSNLIRRKKENQMKKGQIKSGNLQKCEKREQKYSNETKDKQKNDVKKKRKDEMNNDKTPHGKNNKDKNMNDTVIRKQNVQGNKTRTDKKKSIRNENAKVRDLKSAKAKGQIKGKSETPTVADEVNEIDDFEEKKTLLGRLVRRKVEAKAAAKQKEEAEEARKRALEALKKPFEFSDDSSDYDDDASDYEDDSSDYQNDTNDYDDESGSDQGLDEESSDESDGEGDMEIDQFDDDDYDDEEEESSEESGEEDSEEEVSEDDGDSEEVTTAEEEEETESESEDAEKEDEESSGMEEDTDEETSEEEEEGSTEDEIDEEDDGVEDDESDEESSEDESEATSEEETESDEPN